ncbi:MAG: hypothetical protein JW908_06570 [Anaerolineales bacterium]|nr:hypothetical protein [Anaerolineales bacterium]
MKLIENPNIKDKRRKFSLDNLLKTDRLWTQDTQAQESIIPLMQKSLDARYYLLRNVLLEGLDIPIPLILVGPPGLRVLYVSGERGIFRARDEYWEKLDERSQNYRSAQPNLITRTELMGKAVDAFLATHVENLPVVEPVLMFSDPGVHVESIHPNVRVVLMDAMERFFTALVQSRPFLSPQQVQMIVNLLSHSMEQPESEESAAPKQDAFSMKDDEKARMTLPVIDIPVPNDDAAMRLVKKVPISNKQWIVLGCMMLVNILLIVGFVIFILISS